MATPTKACHVREQLFAQFRRNLDVYASTYLGLLDHMRADKASNESRTLYESCVEARKALHDHERDHGCFD
jgi:hypothetical protein